jgi:hypothetical protein
VPAGTATVNVSGTVGEQPVTAQITAPYAAITCG